MWPAQYIDAFARVDDPFIKERVGDIKDVSRRLIYNLLGKNLPLSYRMRQPAVLVANDLTPSEAAILEPNKVRAVVTELGGRTSHASIIARALGVPAVVGVRGILDAVKSGDELLVDGGSGEVILGPSEPTRQTHLRNSDQWNARRQVWMTRTNLPALTQDRQRVSVLANLENVEDAPAALADGAEGVGLFRTEYLFLRQERFPNENEQFEAYRKLLQAFGDRPVTIRTLDLGGDKKAGKYFDKAEKNPFLGYRAIRFCLENRELFKVQLRALLRASGDGALRVMFPMISSAGSSRKRWGCWVRPNASSMERELPTINRSKSVRWWKSPRRRIRWI
jgi:phosphotransferase system enzyme I (PtsI)